jgi:hypothetical protein
MDAIEVIKNKLSQYERIAVTLKSQLDATTGAAQVCRELIREIQDAPKLSVVGGTDGEAHAATDTEKPEQAA